MYEPASSFGGDLAILVHRAAAYDGAAHYSAERRAYIGAETVALEQALARHGILHVQIDKGEVCIIPCFDPALSSQSESRSGIGGSERRDALRRSDIQQYSKRGLHARDAAPYA